MTKEKPQGKKDQTNGKENNFTATRKTSRQFKEKDSRQKENLTAKRKRLTAKFL